MQRNTFSSEPPRRRALTLLVVPVLFLLLVTPLVLAYLRPQLGEVRELLLVRKMAGCGQDPYPESCYLQGLTPLVREGRYQRAADLCKGFGDPACYYAFGRAVSSPHLCLLLREAGNPAVRLCHLGKYPRP